MTKPAIVYVLHHPDLDAVRVGITGTATKRLAGFESSGWQIVRTAEFEAGADAYGVEQRVLFRLRSELGLTPFLSRDQMPYRGATETANAGEISALELWALVIEERELWLASLPAIVGSAPPSVPVQA